MESEYNNITYKYSNIPVMKDAFMFTSKLLAYYYENYQCVRWNFNISHYNKHKNITRSNESILSCYFNPTLRNKFVFIPPFKPEEQVLMIARNNLSECNLSRWINWEITPDGETKFTTLGRLLRPILSPRHKRSSLYYLGIGSLIFQ